MLRLNFQRPESWKMRKPNDTFLLLLSTLGLTRAAPALPPADADATIKYTLDPASIPEGVHYRPICAREKAYRSNQPGVDFSKPNIYGTFVDSPKGACEGCGREIVPEDFVDVALKAGIHGRDFMIKSFAQAEKRGEIPSPHEISGSSCGTKYKRMMQWASGFSWTYPNITFKGDGESEVNIKPVEKVTAVPTPADE
ncbi:RBP protein [Venturia nashicola]|nr:RBP protein [Venturia nashicola]